VADSPEIAIQRLIILIRRDQMNEKKTASVMIGAMNLLAIGAPMLANQTLKVQLVDQKMEQVNSASIKSIESTWLQVPTTCKARAFNASPVSLENKEMALQIQSIYSFYQA
jgi:hypothetical protein